MTEPNQAQREQWNGESAHRWVADADRRDAVLQPIADLLLSAADLRVGENVLDVGCGCGMTSLAAHELVAPAAVIGIDISEPMLQVATERAKRKSGLSFVNADAQTHTFAPNTVDVVISRFGTMFFEDPVAAHANLRTAVTEGGRLRLATWQPLTANAWLMTPGAVLLRHGTMPDSPPGPGMFAQADPNVVAEVLDEAGWLEISVKQITVNLRLGSDAADATDYLAETGIARRVLETIDPELRPKALAEVTELLTNYDDDGIRLDAGINVISARNDRS